MLRAFSVVVGHVVVSRANGMTNKSPSPPSRWASMPASRRSLSSRAASWMASRAAARSRRRVSASSSWAVSWVAWKASSCASAAVTSPLGDEAGHLGLLERGAGGVRLSAQLGEGCERRFHRGRGQRCSVVDGVIHGRPACAGCGVSAVVLGRAVRQPDGERAVLGKYLLFGDGGSLAQATAPVLGQGLAVVAEQVERIHQPGRVGIGKVVAPGQPGADQLTGERRDLGQGCGQRTDFPEGLLTQVVVLPFELVELLRGAAQAGSRHGRSGCLDWR